MVAGEVVWRVALKGHNNDAQKVNKKRNVWCRQNAAEIKAVEPAEEPVARTWELKDSYPASRPGDAHHFGDAFICVGDIA